ncbi:unnamed protein product, partial [Ceratitis capitata]
MELKLNLRLFSSNRAFIQSLQSSSHNHNNRVYNGTIEKICNFWVKWAECLIDCRVSSSVLDGAP